LRQEFSAGRIEDVTGGVFIYKSPSVTAHHDTGVNSSAAILSLPSENVPEELQGLVSANDECAVVFAGGVCGDTLVLIKERPPYFEE
jgi:hypothetical protein